MYKKFREQLNDAKGHSEYVIVINVDIRGFSKFSKTVDSNDTATYIKRVYIKLIDEYFSYASFYKPTGDGLLIAISYDDKNLKDMTQQTIDTCFKVVSDFKKFSEGDDMINFPVPDKIGIGLSRGAACRLSNNDLVLDYSGKVLNLASRLMDFARPSGIVFDSNLKITLLSEEQQQKFESDSIYIKGIAEDEPILIYYSKEFTQIPIEAKRPISKPLWKRSSNKYKLKDAKKLGNFYYELTGNITKEDIKVVVNFPKIVNGELVPDIESFKEVDFAFHEVFGKPQVAINYIALASTLVARGVTDDMKITVEINYPDK